MPAKRPGVGHPVKAGIGDHCPISVDGQAGAAVVYLVDRDSDSGFGSRAKRGLQVLRTRRGGSRRVANTAIAEGKVVSRVTRKVTMMATWQRGLSHQWVSEPTCQSHADGDRRVDKDMLMGRLSCTQRIWLNGRLLAS